MNTTNTLISSLVGNDWKSNLHQKVAMAQTRDDQEVAEAFAQQAYTAVGNRDRAIMKDPHLLGFEVIDKNEDNSRLLGAFAFRIAGEIYIVPVFFLNGQIKGHQMIYRKGVKRFYPNNEKWISYFLSKEEGGEGEVIDRNSRQSRLHLPIRELMGKQSAVEAEIEECMELFKTASAETWAAWEKEAAEGILDAIKGKVQGAYDYAAGNDLKQQIAEAQAEAAEDMAKVKALNAQLDSMQTPEPTPEPAGIGAKLKGLATNPYALTAAAVGLPVTALLASKWNKNRKKKKMEEGEEEELDKESSAESHSLIKALWKEAMEEWKVTPPEHLFADALGTGLQKQAAELASRYPEFAEWIVLGESLENFKEAHEVLPEPVLIYHTSPPIGKSEEIVSEFYKRGFAIDDRRTDAEVRERIVTTEPEISLNNGSKSGVRMLLTKEGPVKVLWGSRDEECCGDRSTEYMLVALEGTHKGKYATFYNGVNCRFPDNKMPMFVETYQEQDLEDYKPKVGDRVAIWCCDSFVTRSFEITSLVKKDGITRINFDKTYGTRVVINPEIDSAKREDRVLYIGENAKFVKLKTPKRSSDEISDCCDDGERMPEIWFSRDNVQSAIVGNIHKVKFTKQGNFYELELDGKVVGRDLTVGQTAIKMAALGKLRASDAIEALEKGISEFDTIDPTFDKSAAAYFDREVDFDAEFGGDESFDPDLLLRMLPADQQARIVAIRQQQPSRERRYLDAKGYGGAKNLTHIPDEVILQMTDPARQMAEMGQQLGMSTLIDHGALSALTKVFDAAPFIKEYVGKLDESLDYLARLLFLLFWKPKDFSKTFGEDDLVNMENKLLGVFDAYGDLVLELIQSTGDKGDI